MVHDKVIKHNGTRMFKDGEVCHRLQMANLHEKVRLNFSRCVNGDEDLSSLFV